MNKKEKHGGEENDSITNRKSTRNGKKLETKEMKTKPRTFLLALTFLFLFSGSSIGFAHE